MEMIIISLCLTTILALLLFKQLLERTATKINLPPSPWRLPVIGNLHQLSLHPHRSLRSLSFRYGPLMLLHFGRVPVLVVSSSDVAHDIMKTHDFKVANRPKLKVVEKFMNGGRDVAFSPYGEYWRHIKSVCVIHLLSKKMVQSFEKVREEEISLMMESVEKASSSTSPLNLSELLMTLTSDVTSRVSLGRKHSNEESMSEFKNQVRAIMELVGGFPVGEYIPCLAWIDKLNGLDDKLKESSEKFGGLMDKVVQEHVEADKPTHDLVDIMLSLERQKKNGIEVRRSDIKFIILDMFLGGTTTTYALLEWIMTELIRHPVRMKKLQEEIRTKATSGTNLYRSQEDVEGMKYLKAVIKEGLRLHPPFPLLVPRLLTEDVNLRGCDIAAGTQVIVNAWAIQRDTVSWGTDAEEFRPERHSNSSLDFRGTSFELVPFGSGRRMCPGIGFALALVEVTLANLVNRFNWRMDARVSGDEYDLAETTGLDVCRKFPLIVFPSPA